MAIDKRISYIFHDSENVGDLFWQGYEEDFDSAATTVADKKAEAEDLRTSGTSQGLIKFVMIFDL